MVESRVPAGLTLVVCSISLVLAMVSVSGAQLSGRALSMVDNPEVADWLLHLLFEWSSATLALVIGLFAIGRWLSDRGPESLALGVGFAMVALFEGVHALSGELNFENADAADGVLLSTWLSARLVLSLVLFLSIGVATWVRPGRSATIKILGLTGAVAVLGFLASRWFLPGQGLVSRAASDPLLPRPWELLPLGLFLASALLILPRLHRQRKSILTHALIVAALPQVVAQLEAGLGSLAVYDSHFFFAHLQELLAYSTLLVGQMLDYVHTQRSRQVVVSEIESAQLELLHQTREIERIDQAFVEQGKSLRMLEKAVETMSMGVTVTDLEGRILYVNPADARMHGYQVDELVGRNARIFAPSGRAVRRGPRTEYKPWARERLNQTGDGRIFPVRLVSDVVRDESAQAIAVVTICEDISERKRIREILKSRDRILEAVSWVAETFLAEPSLEEEIEHVLARLGRATHADRVYLAQVEPSADTGGFRHTRVWSHGAGTGGDPRLQPNLPVSERWHERLREGRILQVHLQDLEPAMREQLLALGIQSMVAVPIFVQSAWWGYLRLEDLNPRSEWARAELEALRTAARTFGAAMQRQLAEQALATSEARYRDLLENANDLIQSVTPEGRFEFVNRSWKQALGYDSQEVAELSVFDVVRADHHERCLELMSRVLAGEDVESFEVTFVTKEQREMSVEGNVSCRWEDGHPVATLGIFRDITERREVDRMKQEFISTVSHELRTPLTSIIASLALLNSGQLKERPERTQELVSVAHRNGNRLLQLINDLLDLQKLAAGRMVFRPQSILVVPLLEEALSGIQAFAETFTVRLECEVADEELRVFADRDRLMQVLNNLLSNAIKFSPTGEEVHLGARREGENVVLSVTDLGPGIPDEFREQLFKKFTQIDSSTTRRSPGSGLGLNIVKGLVERMQGTIHLDSRLGEGTVFHVTLPLAASEEATTRSGQPARAPSP